MSNSPSPAGAAGTAAVIGLGSMGFGMAQSLRRAGFRVRGYDVAAANVQRFADAGGEAAASAANASADAGIVVCAVVNAAQTESAMSGEGGAIEAAKRGAVLISSATMDPESAKHLGERWEAAGGLYLDAPMSGGAARAASGELTFMASGSPEAFKAADAALTAMAAKVYELGDRPGIGAAFKMINQLLAGVHIAAAAEAMTFAAKQGLDLAKVYEVISASAGSSWMFENRVPQILNGDYHPYSAIEIFVKDLGIVQDMARAERYPVPLAAAALQMYLAASGAGYGRDGDASLAKVYAQLSQVELPKKSDKTGAA